MFDFALKNIQRRKSRTILTTLGIVIGIAAIVSLGSFSQGMMITVTDQLSAMAGKVMIVQEGASMQAGFQGSDITNEQLEMVRELPGADRIIPFLFFVPPFGPMSGGPPQYVVVGMEVQYLEDFIGKQIEMSEGRKMDEGETEVAIIGESVPENMDLKVGDFFDFKEISFEIIGIVEETGVSDVDMGIIVPLSDMEIALDTDTYQLLYAVLEDPNDAEEFADEVESSDESLNALTSTEIARQVSGIIDQVSLFTLGIGAIAAFVGGLGVLNTMIMAVMERKREIGVMKAIGATKRYIITMIIIESSLLSLIGGLVGLFLGWLGSMGISMATGGFITAVVTPGLALGSLFFAFLLGFLGGLYPAWKAARLDPVDALRG